MAPIFGSIIDNARPNRLGKRRPFLLAGIPIMSIASVLIWLPPLLCSSTGCWDQIVTVFFFLTILVYYFGFSLVRNSYLSMLPEQAQVDKNRIAISGLQGVFSIVATIIGIVLPFAVQSMLEDPDAPFHTTPDGRLLLTTIPVMAVIFAVSAIAVTVFAFFSVDESFHKANESRQKTSVKAILADIFKPFANMENLRWLVTAFLMNAGMRMVTSILVPFATFVLDLKEIAFLIFIIALLPFTGIGFVFWQKRVKKGMKATLIQSSIAITLAMASATILLFDMDIVIKVAIAFAIVALCLFCIVVATLIPNPIISKLVDLVPSTDPVKQSTQNNQSGAYFGSYLFMLNIANVVGDIIFGLILTGGNEKNPYAIGIFFPICAVFYLVAVLVFKGSRIE
jgi:GPH family glycoside/pentoside/hexuronide:cation symporter